MPFLGEWFQSWADGSENRPYRPSAIAILRPSTPIPTTVALMRIGCKDFLAGDLTEI